MGQPQLPRAARDRASPLSREGGILSLDLVRLTFGDQKRLASEQVMYEDLECCKERCSLAITGGILPLRGQTSNTEFPSCQTIEGFCDYIDSKDSTNEGTRPDKVGTVPDKAPCLTNIPGPSGAAEVGCGRWLPKKHSVPAGARSMRAASAMPARSHLGRQNC
ncbi:protein ELYS-like isoform X2 [Cuculus canorus]|uniref:protein ELYS-like isoform X2 n=1 Tax=Cuculus canorus TaxID=55661 RepID=UPI0023AAA8E9|nr:protein ELYS-like isoform X2 [Cuculus canorus]